MVAKLPFVPFSLLQKISHRGLEGEDPTDCAVVSERGGTQQTYVAEKSLLRTLFVSEVSLVCIDCL